MNTANARSRGKLVTAFFCLSAALTGCVSPYVQRPVVDNTRVEPPTSLPTALAYASNTREAYRAKIIELGESERALSNGLITLGAALIAAGAYGAHRDTLVGGALFGGTAYSLGLFNTDKRRAVIYVAGMKALSCAEGAVSPLNFDAASSDRLQSAVDGVGERIERVTRAIAVVEDLVRKVEALGGSTTETVGAQQDVVAARQAISKGISAQGGADQLLVQRSIAGSRLKTAVDDIDTQILDAIRGTEGALQAVPQIIAGLVQSSQIFVPQIKLEDALKPKTAEGPHSRDSRLTKMRPELAAAVAALKGETALLESAAARLSALVAAADPAKALETLKACKVDGLPGPMTVEPQELTFKAKTADKKTLLIDGGAEPYFVYLEGHATGLTVEQPLPKVIIVSASDQTVADTYRLVVQDKTRQKRQIVSVKVVAADAPKAPPPAATTAADELVAAITAKGKVNVSGTDVSVSAQKRQDGGVDITYNLAAGSALTEDAMKAAIDKEFEIADRGIANVTVTRGPDVGPHARGGRRGQPGTTRGAGRDRQGR